MPYGSLIVLYIITYINFYVNIYNRIKTQGFACAADKLMIFFHDINLLITPES